ncbi:Uncharacterised protein [Pantoea agglomerans]|uniref:Uncharacterized protein n=1 Tax=Enterobacter agglomerans TaxID=549 RepID=A0A379ADH0_ENTAG|nr:Uncharacterised protein [Pantoea agglomerans]
MKQSYRGRMFWKIFIGFWIVFVIMSQLIWLGFTLSGKRHEPPELVAIRRIVDLQMTSAASVLERGGPDALNAMLSDWDNSDQQFFHVTQQTKPSQSEKQWQPGYQRALS